MKTNKKLSDLTLEELIEKKKKLQGAVKGLGIVMCIACLILLGLAIKSGNYALIAVAICCSVTLLPSFMGIKQLDSEIKSRNKV